MLDTYYSTSDNNSESGANIHYVDVLFSLLFPLTKSSHSHTHTVTTKWKIGWNGAHPTWISAGPQVFLTQRGWFPARMQWEWILKGCHYWHANLECHVRACHPLKYLLTIAIFYSLDGCLNKYERVQYVHVDDCGEKNANGIFHRHLCTCWSWYFSMQITSSLFLMCLHLLLGVLMTWRRRRWSLPLLFLCPLRKPGIKICVGFK